MGFDRKQLKQASKPMYGFGRKRIAPVGSIFLPVSFDSLCNARTKYITFDVVDMNYPCNAIFGRGLLNTFEVVLHSVYLCLKIPATLGVISIYGNQKDARNIEQGFTSGHINVKCLQDEKSESTNNASANKNKESFTDKPAIEPECETKRVPLDPRMPDKIVMISQDLSPSEEMKLLLFLDKNNDIFAWKASDLTWVSRSIIERRLQVNPSAKPKKQMLCKMFDKKVAAAKSEVQRLLDVGFICEIQYPSWLTNVVMVKKKNGKWRICTDFTDLNKYYPKDDFLVLRIDKVVDSTAGCETTTLLDYFSRYHQIWLCQEGEEKTSFITPFGTYY
jgi:hypothetical protein